ncbi:MAG: hypothetical protein AAF196_17975 [Planctomycetota bacterium]
MSLLDLWAPILVASVAVFFVSALLHMIIPWHKADAVKMPDEDTVLDAMRKVELKPGHYFFPGCESMEEMKDPEFLKKCEQGPGGFLIVRAEGAYNMGRSLVLWFLQSAATSVLVAYLASLALSESSDGYLVFRVTAVAALLGYCFSTVQESIWKGARWSVTWKFVVDGLLYALATGACFSWLWPGA